MAIKRFLKDLDNLYSFDISDYPEEGHYGV